MTINAAGGHYIDHDLVGLSREQFTERLRQPNTELEVARGVGKVLREATRRVRFLVPPWGWVDYTIAENGWPDYNLTAIGVVDPVSTCSVGDLAAGLDPQDRVRRQAAFAGMTTGGLTLLTTAPYLPSALTAVATLGAVAIGIGGRFGLARFVAAPQGRARTFEAVDPHLVAFLAAGTTATAKARAALTNYHDDMADAARKARRVPEQLPRHDTDMTTRIHAELWAAVNTRTPPTAEDLQILGRGVQAAAHTVSQDIEAAWRRFHSYDLADPRAAPEIDGPSLHDLCRRWAEERTAYDSTTQDLTTINQSSTDTR